MVKEGGSDQTNKCEEKDFPVFECLNHKAIRELRGLIREIEFGEKQMIFQQGAPGLGAYLIYKGRVKLVNRMPNGKKQLVEIFGPAELLLEGSLFDKELYKSYAKTLEPTIMGFIVREEFFDFLAHYPGVMFKLLSTMACEIRALRDKLALRSYFGIRERVARLCLQVGKAGVKLTRKELAQMVGTHRRTSSKALYELEDRGFISLHNNEIIIEDEEKLQKMFQITDIFKLNKDFGAHIS